jgi:mannose-6-phosphate isomerase-like protein (cupin superfamily)
MSMRTTSFGFMRRLDLPFPVSARCVVMHFATTGRPHTHDVDEVAIAIAGSGIVIIGVERVPVSAGGFVHIPAGRRHHMEPRPDTGLAMLIAYALTPPPSTG